MHIQVQATVQLPSGTKLALIPRIPLCRPGPLPQFLNGPELTKPSRDVYLHV